MPRFNFLTGLESGNLGDFTGTTGTLGAFSTVSAKTGTYVLRTNPTTTAVGHARFTMEGTDVREGMYVGFYISFQTEPASGYEPFISFRDNLQLCVNENGNLMIYGTSNTPLSAASATTIPVDGTWIHFEIFCLFRSFDGGLTVTKSFIVKIDGQRVTDLEDTYNEGDTTSSGISYVRFGKTVNMNGNTVSYYYDDIVVSMYAENDITNGIPTNFDVESGWVGECSCVVLKPTGAGTYSNWTTGTGTTFAEVDDIPTSTASYIQTATLTDKHTFTYQNANTVFGINDTNYQILAVKLHTIAIRSAGGTTTINAIIRNPNGDENTEVSQSIAGTSAILNNASGLYQKSPFTGSPWTFAELNSCEFGVGLNSNSTVRVTECLILVYYQAKNNNFISF